MDHVIITNIKNTLKGRGRRYKGYMGGEVETEARMEGDEAVGEGRAGNREIKGEENGIDGEDEIRDERGKLRPYI